MVLSTLLIAIGVSTTLFIALRPKLFLIIVKTLPRDLRIIWTFIKIVCISMYYFKFNVTVAKRFREIAKKYPKKTAFYFEDEKWNFEQVDEFTNQVGNYFKNHGIKRQDSVALLMDSRPEFVCIWLGLAKIGVTIALINTNLLSKEALAHAIRSGKTKKIVFGSRFRHVIENVKTVMPELEMFQFNDQPAEILKDACDLKSELQNVPATSLDSDISLGKSEERLIYIYTSGTTGLPKASIIKNSRYCLAFIVFNVGTGLKDEDVLYIPIPLYHSLGGMCGVSQSILNGTTAVLKTKFSASNFWKDCEKFKCTASQYIGEMARYVILAHKNSKERPTYRLKKMYGNSLKPTTWKQFVEMFNVDQIYEFYGSTEGNFGLFNLDNTIGSIGYIPVYGDPFAPIALIKCNSSGEPIRNDEGFCEVCDYNEPGLLISKISKFIPMTKFDGYSDAESTKKKILRDVLKKGDLYFNTGDVLVRDDHGYFYFRDRTGDTFRWKSENVSTNEVEDIISTIVNKDVAVYGVEVPGSEGKCGMAAIVDETKTLDLKQFLQECKANLPSYSIPIFLRIVDKIPQTGTFKIQKVDFQKEGYNIDLVKDDVYFLDPSAKEYIKLNKEIYQNIMESRLRI